MQQGATPLTPPQFDEHLRCPACDYNVSGLEQPRCPECGRAFDWDAVRRAAVNPPRIAFESAHGWGRVVGFIKTWVAVMFVPWIFAPQAVKRISAKHASVFVAICFATTLLSLLYGAGNFIIAWLLTAVVYLVAQTLWLSLIDPQTWLQRRPPLRFWLLIGFYTSAVMMTEFAYGPPLLTLSELLPHRPSGKFGPPFFFTFDGIGNVVWWVQLTLWLVALGCCHAARFKRPTRPWAYVVPASLLVVASLFVLYATIVEHVGGHIYDWVGRLF